MAATSGKMRFAVSASPIETVTSGSTEATTFDVPSVECYGSVGGSGEVAGVAYVDVGGANDGYLNGSPVYFSAPTGADNSGQALTSLASCKFLYLKHTGFEFSSTSALSTTTNTVDALTILITGGTDHTVIARLLAGESIVLPMRGGSNISQIEVSSSDGGNLDSTTGLNTIAVEMIAVA